MRTIVVVWLVAASWAGHVWGSGEDVDVSGRVGTRVCATATP